MQILTVTEITQYIRTLVESDEILGNLSVKGEISNYSESLAGHCYFTLKDRDCQLRCVLFRGSKERLPISIREGVKVIAQGRITIYPKSGQYQLIVESLKEEGMGELYEKFLKLKEKLSNEGLFDPSAKVPLPFFPRTVGVVTSPYGAAIRDIITTIRKRNNSVRIVLAPVTVQGDDAPESICDGLARIQQISDVQVIIIGRGGGSFEELMAFNDERVARAIYNCKIPLVSAVGHETDFSISDMVADLRAATPTAAAQVVVPDRSELQDRLESFRKRMSYSVKKLCQSHAWKLDSIGKRYVLRFPKRHLEGLSQNLDRLISRQLRAIQSTLNLKSTHLKFMGEKLESYNPGNILERGYCIAYRMPQNLIVRKVEDIAEGDRLRVLVSNGDIDAEVRSARSRLL